MRAPSLFAVVLTGAAAVACGSTPPNKPGAPVEVPIPPASAAPPLQADAGTEAEQEDPSGIVEWIDKAFSGREKVRQCDALIEVINEGVRNLENGLTGSNGASDLRRMADIMDAVDAKVAKIKLTVTELKEYAAAYRKMASEIAKAARETAAAADAQDAPRFAAAQVAMDKAVQIEDPLVDEINQFCQAP